jgi:FtsP/CotA-like multicopper oxidase with cupredoxin domain
MTTLFSRHATLRRVGFLTGMLMLLLSVGSSGALAATPSSPAPAAAAKPSPATAAPAAQPQASASASAAPAPKATPKVTPKAVTPPAPKKVGPRVLGPQAVASATLALPNCLVTCILYAKEGTIALPGASVPIWGFTGGPTGLIDPATLPGPTLITMAGTPLSIILCNLLPAADGNLSLELPGAPVTPDLTGVPGASVCVPGVSSNSRSYTLNGLAPGTYLYEAGATPQGPRQVAMGLSGILIVRPADYLPVLAQTAYGAASPRPGPFTAEATVLVSEIDSEFNASPLTKDLVEYQPNYFLLNGHAFDPANPTVGKIDVVAGDQLLLHQADLGLRDHEMGILGARQSIQANDSHFLTNPVNVATSFLTAGQVADSFVQVDPGLGLGSQLPLYDSGLHLHNDANPGLGGMMTYLDVIAGLGGLPGGPITTDVVVDPKINDGTQTETVKGTITAQLGIVTAAEWFLDDIGAPGTGHPIAVPLNLGSTNFTFTITPADLLAAIVAAGGTPDSDHIIWVHGKDLLNWGEASGDTLTLNVSGPLVYAITLHPDRTNGLPLSPTAPSGPANDQDGTADAIILATAQASLNGWVVDGAEYRIDGGAAVPLCTTPEPTSPAGSCPAAVAGTPSPGGAAIVALNGSIPQAVLNGLADGPHTISIRAHELPPTGTCANPARCYSSWSLPAAQATLVKDSQGPITSNMSVAPNPNNGTLSEAGNLGFLDAVRVTATLNDTTTGGSDVILGEAFLGDSAPPTTIYGSGAEMVPSTAKWAGVNQVAYAYIPLQEIKAHPEGLVKIWVHGKDSAGNWGTPQSVSLTLDITPPTITSATATGTTGNATIQVNANDPLSGGVHSNIVTAEWFVGTDPGYGGGHAVTVPAPSTTVSFSFPVTGQAAVASVHVRVVDAAGNWSTDSIVVIP